MNKNRLILLAKKLATLQPGPETPYFGMHNYFGKKNGFSRTTPIVPEDDNWCGTSACIAGHALVAFAPSDIPFMISEYEAIFDNACQVLGLTVDKGGHLFLTLNARHIDFDEITSFVAAVCICNFVRTERVDWDEAVAQVKSRPFQEDLRNQILNTPLEME